MDEKKEYLTPSDLSNEYSLNIGTLEQDRHHKRGIDYIKVGSKVLYKRIDIETYLEANKVIVGKHNDNSKDGLISESIDFDELYEDAKTVILTYKKTSISYLQRRLHIGYNRSARIVEQLEMMGVISAPNTKGVRTIL